MEINNKFNIGDYVYLILGPESTPTGIYLTNEQDRFFIRKAKVISISSQIRVYGAVNTYSLEYGVNSLEDVAEGLLHDSVESLRSDFFSNWDVIFNKLRVESPYENGHGGTKKRTVTGARI